MFCVRKDAREASQVRLFYLINTIHLTLKMRNVNADILSQTHATEPFEINKKMSGFLFVCLLFSSFFFVEFFFFCGNSNIFLAILRYHFYSLAYYFSSYCLGL